MKTVVELVIQLISNNNGGYADSRKGEYLAEAIQSMIGVKPTCLFFSGQLKIQFTHDQFEKVKGFYGRKWRSNVTHEVKRHCAMHGYSPNLRGMKIVRL